MQSGHMQPEDKEEGMTAHMLQRRAGFTLLELMMVVIIMAILASIALPQYLRTSERARAAEAIQMLGAMRTTQTRYYALNNENYATKADELDIGLVDSDSWHYTMDATTKIGIATRQTGEFANKIININLDTGKLCSNAPQYGLPNSCT